MSKIQNAIMRSVLAAIFIINVNTACADPSQQVHDYINSLANQTINIVQNKSTASQEKTDQIFLLLRNNFNLEWMAKFVLAQNYRQLSPSQKTEYQSTYAEFFLHNYLPNLMQYTDESFRILRVLESTPGSFTVETQILRSGGKAPVSINYQVKSKQENIEQYQVIDVVVEGISAIMSQRSEFASTIQQSGVDGFIIQLQNKVKVMSSKS